MGVVLVPAGAQLFIKTIIHLRRFPLLENDPIENLEVSVSQNDERKPQPEPNSRLVNPENAIPVRTAGWTRNKTECTHCSPAVQRVACTHSSFVMQRQEKETKTRIDVQKGSGRRSEGRK